MVDCSKCIHLRKTNYKSLLLETLRLDVLTGTTNTCNRSQGHSTTVNIQSHAFHLFPDFAARSSVVFSFERNGLRLTLQQASVFESVTCTHALCIFVASGVYFTVYLCNYERQYYDFNDVSPCTETTHFPERRLTKTVMCCCGSLLIARCSCNVRLAD